MTDDWTPLLSRYVDDDLEPGERRALETHVQRCAECRDTVEQLRCVRTWARSHPGVPPRRDVWPNVAAAIRQPARGRAAGGRDVAQSRRWSWLPATRVQALAAGISLVAVAAGSWWMSRKTMPVAVIREIATATWEPSIGPSAKSAILAAQTYSAAIAQLEQAVFGDPMSMDTSTVRLVKEQLAIVDRAIAEARAALAGDPNSGYLADHFANMMRKKLAVLRNVARS